VVAEVGYLIARKGGLRAEAQFLTSLADGDFGTVDLTRADFRRMAELVEQYADLPLGTTDASVVAIAERLAITEIASWIDGTSPWCAPVTWRASSSCPEA
jgi:uncharacterized protein